MENKTYQVNLESADLDEIISNLSVEFSDIVKEETTTCEKEYFDSFDTRLLKNNISLYCCSNLYTLVLADKTEKTFQSRQKPKLLNDLPEEIKKILAPVLEIRALLSVIKLRCEETKITFLNEDQKIVLRGKFEKISLENYNLFTIIPLRGYEKKLIKTERILIDKASCHHINTSSFLDVIYSKSQNVNMDYVDKPVFNLLPDMNSYDALIMILRVLLNVLKANEKGVINDYDTEFLHDYRIAIRKTRAIFGQLGRVFNLDLLENHKTNLTNIASATNKLRDMDVYLLSENEYKSMLPEHLHQELDVFFKDVAKKKRKENRIVSRMLLSSTYSENIKAWDEYLSSEDKKQRGSEAKRKVVNLAKSYIYKRYQKIIKQGKIVKKHSPDDDYHRVRISCKKLRYLMELFSSLFQKNEISMATKQLKNIQDSLGNFNDMCMQQIHLDEYLHELSGRKTDNAKIAAAIGGLITSTYNRKKEYRLEFYLKFDKFSSIENDKLFKRLFK